MEKDSHKDPVVEAVEMIEAEGNKILSTVKKQIEDTVDPLRKTAFQRFPFLFMLLGAFGTVSVFYGLERMLAHVSLLEKYPWLTVLFGISILYLTGKLYKKLS